MRKMNGKSEEEKVKHYNHMGSHLDMFMLHNKVIEEVKNTLSNSYSRVTKNCRKNDQLIFSLLWEPVLKNVPAFIFLVSYSDIHMPTCVNTMPKFPDGNGNFWFHIFIRWTLFTSKQVGKWILLHYTITYNIQMFLNLNHFKIQLEHYLLLSFNESILWDAINKDKHL